MRKLAASGNLRQSLPKELLSTYSPQQALKWMGQGRRLMKILPSSPASRRFQGHRIWSVRATSSVGCQTRRQGQQWELELDLIRQPIGNSASGFPLSCLTVRPVKELPLYL